MSGTVAPPAVKRARTPYVRRPARVPYKVRHFDAYRQLMLGSFNRLIRSNPDRAMLADEIGATTRAMENLLRLEGRG